MSEEEIDFDKFKEKLNKADWLKRFAQYRTMIKQVDEAEEECKKLNKDVRDSFHVVGTSEKDGAMLLHIITSGKEGEESARQTLREVANAEDLDIANKSTERYDAEKDKEELQDIAQALMRWAERQDKKKSLKGGD